MASRQSRSGRQGPACRACRLRRLACDKARPSCARCRETSRTCSYDPDRRQTRTEYTFVDETPQSISGHAEAGPSSRVRTSSSRGSTEPTVELSSSRLAEIESRLEALTAAVRSTRSDEVPISGLSGLSAHQSMPSIEPLNETQSVDAVVSSMGRLSFLGNGRARFVTGSFWANICDEATAIDEMLREQTRYTGAAKLDDKHLYTSLGDNESGNSDFVQTAPASLHDMYPYGDILSAIDDWHSGPPSSRYQRAMPDIIAELPPKSLCDRLFESFVLFCHPVAPLVHVPTTRTDYELFWEASTGSKSARTALCTPLITAILFAGANACEESVITSISGRRKGEVIADLHLLTAKTLRYANFPRTPTIESFIAYITIQNTCMREEQPLTCCSYAGTAVRVAQMLGCNRDPSSHPLLTPIVAEVRRRVVWQVFYLDTLVALAAGLPPLIDTESWSIRLVSELKDEFIGTAEGAAYEELVRTGERALDQAIENSFVPASGIFVAGKYHQAVVTRAVMTKLNGQQPLTDKVLVDIQNELEALNTNISSRRERLEHSHSQVPQDPSDIFAKWAGLLLSGLADRNWSYLYYPLSHVSDGSKWQETLDQVLQHSRSYVEKMVALTCLKEFGPLQWSWPGIHQPLHAVMVLVRHVNRFPHSPHCEANRQAVDEALALCGPDGGMTGVHEGRVNRRPLREGGEAAWDLIRRLRAQAWLKAGVDPDVLLTRDETAERMKMRLADQDITGQWAAEPQFDFQNQLGLLTEEELLGAIDPSIPLDADMDWAQWE
ncbi:uncharacterized protein LY89DRAFT_682404 [Mollisia scopiformis]|uniref:Zn(2)-C6 fungal-type domain-containing protein n=1 Tax=Mollisia scopiformis TaxID=149040 RepID=A0A194XKT2_MOLSC|nr:uncharacterized protein LY89DRAFT_682404 [Mollisia scopiformis]KUJ20704.1 hypothetical protein LY89DRAFT_682404 [Mollisia scopiformis]